MKLEQTFYVAVNLDGEIFTNNHWKFLPLEKIKTLNSILKFKKQADLDKYIGHAQKMILTCADKPDVVEFYEETLKKLKTCTLKQLNIKLELAEVTE